MANYKLVPEEEEQGPAIQPSGTSAYTLVPEDQDRPAFTSQNLAKNIGVIADHNVIMFGDDAKDWDDDKHIENYMERMRGFGAGNTVSTARTIMRLNELEPEQLARVGEAFTLYENYGSAFGKDSTWKDRLEALQDYSGSILLDPANLVGLFAGKLASAGVTKATSTAARSMAIKAGKEAAKKGASKEAIKEAQQKTWVAAMDQLARDEAAKIGTRQAKRVAGKQVAAEVGGTIAMDAAIAAGTEYFYQQGMTMTGAWEGYKPSQVAIAALGTMILGGTAYAISKKGTGASGYNPSATLPNINADAGKALKESLKNLSGEGSAEARRASRTGKTLPGPEWKKKVKAGQELESLDTAFWYEYLSALLPALQKEGFVWVRGGQDENVGNWVANIIKDADPKDAREFLEGFSELTGVKIPELEEAGLEKFANDFAKKISDSARVVGKLAEYSDKLGVDPETVSAQDIIVYMATGELPDTNTWGKKAAEKLAMGSSAIAKHISASQNNIIRLIVSNLSTTRLNLVGYGFSALNNSVSDLSQALLYTTKAGSAAALGKMEAAGEAWRISRNLYAMQIQRAKNLIDPNTTADQFKAMTLNRPGPMRELTATLQGGVEDNSSLFSRIGIQEGDTAMGVTADRLVNAVQMVNGVRAQDLYTKSQEFLYQMDKNTRLIFNRPLFEIWQDPNVRTIMATEEWAKAEAKAVYETSRAIYSQTYRRAPGTIGEVARFIEDFRNIPVIGITIPFGRFYINVIATSMDMSGISVFAKAISGNTLQKERSFTDLGVRAAVSWAAVSALADVEEQHIQDGLGTFEWKNAKGETVDSKYTFPGSLYKGLARYLAYKRQGKEPPETLMGELLDHANAYTTIMDAIRGPGQVPANVSTDIGRFAVGQLTRDLTDATDNILEVVWAILREEGLNDPKAQTGLLDLLMRPVVSGVSGATRTFEPLSTVAQLIRGSDMEVLDPKDGVKWFNESTRYIWNFTSNVQKFDAASGKRGVQADKYLGERGNVITDTERVMNLVGLDTWTVNAFTDSPAANNSFNQHFHSALEAYSSDLMRDEKFRNGNLEYKKLRWGKAVEKARKETMDLMMTKANEEDADPRYAMIVRLSAIGKDKLSKAVEAIAPGRDLSDMSYPEMVQIEEFIKYNDEYLLFE